MIIALCAPPTPTPPSLHTHRHRHTLASLHRFPFLRTRPLSTEVHSKTCNRERTRRPPSPYGVPSLMNATVAAVPQWRALAAFGARSLCVFLFCFVCSRLRVSLSSLTLAEISPARLWELAQLRLGSAKTLLLLAATSVRRSRSSSWGEQSR